MEVEVGAWIPILAALAVPIVGPFADSAFVLLLEYKALICICFLILGGWVLGISSLKIELSLIGLD